MMGRVKLLGVFWGFSGGLGSARLIIQAEGRERERREIRDVRMRGGEGKAREQSAYQ